MSIPPVRVLAVDDSDDDLFLLARALEGAPRLKLTASLQDGMAAVAYLRGEGPYRDRLQWPLPDLILLDLKMPRMDGFEVLNWLRTQTTLQCRVVVFTSSLDEADRQKAIELGAEAVHVKPVQPREYAQFMAQLWKKLEPSSS